MAPYSSFTIPAPIGGLNLIDPIDSMDPQDALRLTNVYPQGQYAESRLGATSYATGLGGAVKGLWEVPQADGTTDLIAVANNTIWDVTAGGAGVDITGVTTPTSDEWNAAIFGHRLFLCNGVDVAQVYDGTTVADLSVTGVNEQDLINASIYRERIYFVEKNSASFWYLGTKAVSGAATEYDVSYFLSRGGYLLFAGGYTNRQGETTQDVFIAVSSEGEVLCYTGSNPGDSSWSLIARYPIGRPCGYRAFVQAENDLLIITSAGIIPMSKLFQIGTSLASESISRKINPAIKMDVASIPVSYMWSGTYWRNGSRIIINCPLGASASEQYVMNTETGAWCRYFYANTQPLSWATFENEPYYGGSDGVVYKAENGTLDGVSGIVIDWKAAFNFFGNRGNWKRFLDCRPLLRGTGIDDLGLAIDTDFQDDPIDSTISIASATSTPWGSPWGSPWGGALSYSFDRYSLAGQGFCGAVKMYGTLNQAILQINAMDIRFEQGAQV